MDENENDDLDLGINDAAVVSAVREEVDRRLRIKPPASAAAASPNLVLVDTGRDPFPLLLVGKKLMIWMLDWLVGMYLLRACLLPKPNQPSEREILMLMLILIPIIW